MNEVKDMNLQVSANPASEALTPGLATMKQAVTKAKQAPPRSLLMDNHLLVSQSTKKGLFVSSMRLNSFEVNLEESEYALILVTPINDSPTSE